ncbi:Hypothetical protein LLA12_02025 [Lactococcus lactis subsp. lactis]|nr:Hypothetical protein LLA12_02025 [Lactococcus lactis subsp. lactis]
MFILHGHILTLIFVNPPKPLSLIWAFFAFNPYVYQAIFQGTRSLTRQGLSGLSVYL